MRNSNKKRPYTVHNVPFWLRPFFFVYGYGFAWVMMLIWALTKYTCNIQRINPPEDEKERNYVYCAWHRDLPAYFAAFLPYSKPYIWLNHPLWYMKPIHLFLKWQGINKLVLGSSGNSGRKALAGVIEGLRQGQSTFLNPDGPAGPPYVLKRGVVEMSLQTGVSVIPLHFEINRYIHLPGWDRKRLPLPFSNVKVYCGKPITIMPDNEAEAVRQISEQL